ncbi:MAG: phosphorylase [Bacteroidetes bacterium]|nr:MAG: phosphorylase [Bacteroidota bacterium]
MRIPESELILNPSGSIYHLDLVPEQIADTIFVVGDPGRVPAVSKYFDHIETRAQKREFVTHTGTLAGRRLTVLSTGISTDNIDIVMNELDALVNIDLQKRELKDTHTSLQIIRIGTSGSMQKEVPVGSFVASRFGLGMDNLLHFYEFENTPVEAQIGADFARFALENAGLRLEPYVFQSDDALFDRVANAMFAGITLTCGGFYGPQGRHLRLKPKMTREFLDQAAKQTFADWRLTNLEMETAAIYGLARMLGHRALSCNAILANRVTGNFETDPYTKIDRLIQTVLEHIAA